MALLIDTEHVRPGRRASYFLDAVTTSPMPSCDPSDSRFEADDFRARFHLRGLGDAYLADFLAAGHHALGVQPRVDAPLLDKLLRPNSAGMEE